ncbi:hypothetical protein [Streptomyces sp. NPDC048527]|uniref:hypothetical protein n=1 Tax=Streptomyces sp. NPDC048527 TaxID=3365568 RepID=UPI00371B114F
MPRSWPSATNSASCNGNSTGSAPVSAADRASLATLLTPLPRAALSRLRLLVSPDTVLRRHRAC